MKMLSFAKTLHVATAVLIAVATPAAAQVVINELQYDDTGTADDFEFVELFNSGATPVDISGWTLGGRDASGNNSIATIPAATTLAAGGYYVVGNAAVGGNQTVAGGFLENDAEQVELWNGAFNVSTLIDGFVTEGNKGAASHGALSVDMAAQVGTVYRGNFQSGHINGQGAQGAGTGPVLVSLSRYINGLDSNNNGRDFGVRRATPGAANSTGISTIYQGPNVDSLAVGSEAPSLAAAFVNPRVVDPTAVSTHNPTAIAASPQGGNAVTIWDTEFGGTGASLDQVIQGGGNLNLFVYVDPRLTASGDSEEWIVGMGGGADALHNFAGVTGTVNGSTGLGWAFRRDATTATLRLIDFGAGGPDSTWTILGTIALDVDDLGWHELGIEVNGTTVTGNFDGTEFTGSTISDLVGNAFYASYREGFTSNVDPLLRPLTIDMVPEPSVWVLSTLGGVALLFWRRRK